MGMAEDKEVSQFFTIDIVKAFLTYLIKNQSEGMHPLSLYECLRNYRTYLLSDQDGILQMLRLTQFLPNGYKFLPIYT